LRVCKYIDFIGGQDKTFVDRVERDGVQVKTGSLDNFFKEISIEFNSGLGSVKKNIGDSCRI
jgi:hypothetical protein